MALRFFRKHRKWFMILVFAAVIGIVGWGVFSSDRFQSLLARIMGGGAGGEVVGHIDGREVTAGELSRFATGLRLAGGVSELWYQVLARQAEGQDAAARIFGATLEESAWPILAQQLKDREQIDRATALAWLALYKEARRFGFEVPEVEVEARLDGLRSLGLTGQDIANTVAREARGRRDLLVDGLAYDMTLAAYIRYLFETCGVPVEPELRRAYARQDGRIKLRMAVFKAEEALDDVGTPPEDKIREFFTKYKQYLPGRGPDGIGYRIPPKVAVEYLVAEPAAFEDEAAETVTDESVKAYYEEHKDTEFLVENADAEADEADDEDQDAAEEDESAAEEGDDEKQYRPLSEVRDDIRRRLIRREAEALAHNHLASLVGEISTKQKGIDLRIFADGKRVRYVCVPDLLTAEQLAEVEGLGGATRGRVAVPQAALSVVELVGAEKARLAVDEISEVYTGTGGKAYAFRVTDAVPSREPSGLDEVREAVVEDVRQAEAFRLLRERAGRLLEAAAEKGLEAAAEKAGVETVTSDWFPRQQYVPYGGRWLSFPPALPEVGSSPAVVEECFEMLKDGRERTLVTLGQRQMVVVAELVGRKAPREDGYALFRPVVAQRVSREMAGQAVVDLLEVGSIQRRMAVVVEMPEEGEKEGAEAPPDEDAEPVPDEPQIPMPDIGR
ncbi:MAG: hypothetical protein R6X20_10260 [Phycisphaerae bacterium]